MGCCAKIVSASAVFSHTEPSHTQNYQGKSHCVPVNLHRALTTVQKTNGTRGRGKQPRASAPFPWKQGSFNAVDTYLRTNSCILRQKKHFLSGFQLVGPNLYHWPQKVSIRLWRSSKLFNIPHSCLNNKGDRAFAIAGPHLWNKWISEMLPPSLFLNPDSKLNCTLWLSYPSTLCSFHLLYCP